MSVLVRMPHMEIEIRGREYQKVIDLLKSTFREVYVEEETPIDMEETDWHKAMSSAWSPSIELRTNRLKFQLSQSELGAKIGKSRQYISDLENGRRNITVTLAKTFGEIFKSDYHNFL